MPAAELVVIIAGDSAPLAASLASASAEVKSFSAVASSGAATAENSIASVGSTSRKVLGALGFAGAAVAIGAFAKSSVQAALNYEQAFVKIDAITNASQADIQNMRGSIMDLSHQTAVSPVELANAMYYLASAGLTTTQQMESLDATAKGTAVGLGTSADLSKILTQALNVFGDSGLRAVDVMDTLTAAVRTGTAEPDEFAAAMGRVLPIADKAGISFQQVAASLATMSNAGLKVNIGATALRGLLQALVAPTHQSMLALNQLGLSVDDVVNSLAQHGLIDTLRMLDTAAKKNTNSTGQYNIVMRNLVPNIRALTAAFNLTTQDGAKVDEIFREVVNSGGDLAVAFGVVERSTPFRFKQALNDLSVAGQNLAVNVLPVLAKVLQLVADHTGFFFTALVGFAALKWVAPMFQADAAAAGELATTTGAAAVATNSLAAAQEKLAVSKGGAGLFSASPLAVQSAQALQNEQIAAANAANGTTTALTGAAAAQSTFVAATQSADAAFVRFNLLAKDSTLPVNALASSAGGLTGRVATMGNTIGNSGIPQLLGLADAAQRAYDVVNTFKTKGVGAAALQTQISGFQSPEAQFVLGSGVSTAASSFFSALQKPDLTSFNDAMTTIQAGFAESGVAAGDAQQIINKAMQDIGGSFNSADPQQVAAFVDAVNKEQSAFQQQQAAADQLVKQSLLASQATQQWQNSTVNAGKAIQGLGALTGNATGYLISLRSTLEQSTNPAQDFAAAVADLGSKWRDFQSQTAGQINFLPQGLADLTSAAQQAQTSLKDALANPPDASASAQTIKDYNNNLATLRTQAHLTGQQILQSFKASTAQIKSFSQDLLDISKVGGKAGKDLANSLLQSGNIMAAQIIADAPKKLEAQIVGAFGKGTKAADSWSTKLTNAIVGPLKKIVAGLRTIVEKTWGINLDGKSVDQTDKKVTNLQRDTEHLVTTKHRLNFETNVPTTITQVTNLNESLKNLPTHMLIDIKTHVHGSDLPDEVLRKHLFDPMKRAGFRKTANGYSLPLDVAAHTDLAGGIGQSFQPGGGGTNNNGSGGAMLQTLHRILSVAQDSRGYLKKIAAQGSGGGSGSSTGGSSGTGGTGGGTGGTGSGGGSNTPGGLGQQVKPGQPAITGPLAGMLKDFRRYIASVQSPMYANRWYKEMVKAINTPGTGQNQIMLLKQAMRDMAKVTNPEEAHKAADAFNAAVKEFEQTLKAPTGPRKNLDKLNVDEAIRLVMHHMPFNQIRDEVGQKRMAKLFDQLRSTAERTGRLHLGKLTQILERSGMTQKEIAQWHKEAKQAFSQGLQVAKPDPNAPPKWFDLAFKNVPRLPKGHTNISVNPHNDGRGPHRGRDHLHPIALDRRRFDDQQSYEIAYGRGW